VRALYDVYFLEFRSFFCFGLRALLVSICRELGGGWHGKGRGDRPYRCCCPHAIVRLGSQLSGYSVTTVADEQGRLFSTAYLLPSSR